MPEEYKPDEASKSSSADDLKISLIEAADLHHSGQSALVRRGRDPLFTRLRIASVVGKPVDATNKMTRISAPGPLSDRDCNAPEREGRGAQAFPATSKGNSTPKLSGDPPPYRQRKLSAAEEIANEYRSRNGSGSLSAPYTTTEFPMPLSPNVLALPKTRDMQPLQAVVSTSQGQGNASINSHSVNDVNGFPIYNTNVRDFPLEPPQLTVQRWSTTPSIDSNVIAALRFVTEENNTEEQRRISQSSTDSSPVYGLNGTFSTLPNNVGSSGSTTSVPSEEAIGPGNELSSVEQQDDTVVESSSEEIYVVNFGDKGIGCLSKDLDKSEPKAKFETTFAEELAVAEKIAKAIAESAPKGNTGLRCNHPGCNDRLADEKALKYHIHLHILGDRMLPCVDCNEEFETSDDLNSHVSGCYGSANASKPQTAKSKRSKSPDPFGINSSVASLSRGLFNRPSILCCFNAGNVLN